MAINTSKVVVGGIVAGIVANVIDFVTQTFLFKGMEDAAMAKLNLPTTPTGAAIAGSIVCDFAWMIATIWIYAAIRTRFGPGPKTATYAAIASWAIGTSVAGYFYFAGFFGTNLFLASAVQALINAIIATLVGARFYSEEPAAISERAVA
jgi:hypothetical protein